LPAVTVVPEGLAASEKSAKNKVRATEAEPCAPALPVTVKFMGFAEVALRPVTVSSLEAPGAMEDGLKEQVAPVLQLRPMFPVKVLGADAEIVKLAVFVPIRMTFDRALDESEKIGLPVPVRDSPVEASTALEATAILPVTLPVEVGLKLTETVQDWPTLRVAGTVGKLMPQLLVWAKPLPAVIFVIVTA